MLRPYSGVASTPHVPPAAVRASSGNSTQCDDPEQENVMDTYLPPIERPHSLMRKLIYALTRKRFGKILTPLKVHAARLPLGFGSWYGRISALDDRLSLPASLAILIRQQVARINVCEFCIDIGRWFALQQSQAVAKLDALEEYETSPLFSDAERA